MKQKEIIIRLLLLISLFILNACSLVEMSGTITKKTGEVMEDYGKKNDGFVGQMAGFGGRVNKAVGGAVEDVAKKGASESAEKSKTEQFTGASKEVLNAAIDSVKEEEHSKTDIVLKAQKRLQTLGYDPGPADGVMGTKTRQAIGGYQQSENLRVTEVLDEQTLSALNIHSIE